MANKSEQEKRETLTDIVTGLRANARRFIGAHGVGWCEGGRIMSLADRIEAAWKREKAEIEANALAVGGVVEAARHKPDKNWAKICAKCMDGEIEPECAYYGEPNGCNSPTYGEHPPVCNAAAMREALCDIVMLTMKVGYSIHGDVACGIIASKAKHALSAPARNCDRFNRKDPILAKNEAVQHWQNETDCAVDFGQWLLAPEAERKGEGDGR